MDLIGKVQMPVGESLCANAEALVRGVFDEVEILAAASGSGDAVLAARLDALVRSRPITGYGSQSTLVRVEWTLLDSRGDVVWIGTATGEGSSDMGVWNAEEMATRQMRDATVELVRDSFQQMTAAPSIDLFAEQLRAREAADAEEESQPDDEEQ